MESLKSLGPKKQKQRGEIGAETNKGYMTSGI